MSCGEWTRYLRGLKHGTQLQVHRWACRNPQCYCVQIFGILHMMTTNSFARSKCSDDSAYPFIIRSLVSCGVQ